jgi:hypothetical protein
MKLVMTLVVRDEADVLDAQLAFHLSAGVDLVIATDHRSRDGTTEILESYARDGYVRLIREEGEEIRQSSWVTRMARLAATEHGADWVVNSDADEFWWPRAASLKEALEAVPSGYGVVYAPMCYFLARRDPGPFYEAMTLRLLQPTPINSPVSRFRPTVKAAHRATPNVVVHRGNHEVRNAGRPLHAWHPLEVLHFPDRSPEQCARKYENTVAAWPPSREPGAFVLAAQDAIQRDGALGSFERLAVSDEELARASARWAFETDTRLRDALRGLRLRDGSRFARPRELGAPSLLPRPDAVDDTRHAQDVGALRAADLIRVQRRVDDLGHKLKALESDTGR